MTAGWNDRGWNDRSAEMTAGWNDRSAEMTPNPSRGDFLRAATRVALIAYAKILVT